MKTPGEIIKKNIPNGIINIKAVGKGNGKPQKQAEDDVIIKCILEYHEQFKVLPPAGKSKEEIRKKITNILEDFDTYREADMDGFVNEIMELFEVQIIPHTEVKSKLEIINDSAYKVWYDINGTACVFLEHALEAMDLYRNQPADAGVCEWKYDEENDCYHTCKHDLSIFNNTSDPEKDFEDIGYTYCVYCGKPIKRI